ncbi:MAG TPA: polysaccharide deacetylase family protein, partial [Saprospiraceae bacterium]|nr:polysaccharide deacetylase family protein [Saprospiraceae bacterium]
MIRPLYRALRFIGKGTVNYVHNKVRVPVVVLVYHRVTKLALDPQLLAVTPDLFREHLEILKTYPILRFEDDWSDAQEPSVVITFDDGYADNFHEVMPILTDFGVPATFFVSAGAIGSQREFWWDELERLILTPSTIPDRFRLHGFKCLRPMEWTTRTSEDRMKLYADMHAMIAKSHEADLCDCIIRELQCWSGLGEKGRKTHRSMDCAELEALAQNPLVT